MYRTVVTIYTTSLTFKIPRSPHTLYLSVLCGSQNKQPLFPYTTLTDWFFVTETESVYSAVRTGCLYNIRKLPSVQHLPPTPSLLTATISLPAVHLSATDLDKPHLT